MMSEFVTHRCADGTETELEKGRYLPDAQEYRTGPCPNCEQVVYHNGTVTHE
jgi:hypothetical protein